MMSDDELRKWAEERAQNRLDLVGPTVLRLLDEKYAGVRRVMSQVAATKLPPPMLNTYIERPDGSRTLVQPAELGAVLQSQWDADQKRLDQRDVMSAVMPLVPLLVRSGLQLNDEDVPTPTPVPTASEGDDLMAFFKKTNH